MRERLSVILLALGAVAFWTSPAMATPCTVSLTCNNACTASLQCPVGPSIGCSAPKEVISCSGSTETGGCSTPPGGNSVVCGSVTKTCEPTYPRCVVSPSTHSIRCDNIYKECPTCGSRVCQVAPQPVPDFFALPAAAGDTPAAAD